MSHRSKKLNFQEAVQNRNEGRRQQIHDDPDAGKRHQAAIERHRLYQHNYYEKHRNEKRVPAQQRREKASSDTKSNSTSSTNSDDENQFVEPGSILYGETNTSELHGHFRQLAQKHFDENESDDDDDDDGDDEEFDDEGEINQTNNHSNNNNNNNDNDAVNPRLLDDENQIPSGRRNTVTKVARICDLKRRNTKHAHVALNSNTVVSGITFG